MRKLLIVLICVITISTVFPQNSSINFFQNSSITWGTSQNNYNKLNITSANDSQNNIYYSGNYELTGLSYIKKFNSRGIEIYTHNFSESVYPNSNGQLKINSLNQFVIAAQKITVPNVYSLRIICMDSNRNILWDVTAPNTTGAGTYTVADVMLDSENNIYIVTDVTQTGQPTYDCCLFKFSAGGQFLWQKLINTSTSDKTRNSIYSMGENSFSMIITHESFSNNFFTPYEISKSTGEVIRFELNNLSSFQDYKYSVKTFNGNTYLAYTSYISKTRNSPSSIAVKKFNSNLDTLWTVLPSGTEYVYSMEIDNNENIYLTGNLNTKSLTKNGNLRWTSTRTGINSKLEDGFLFLYAYDGNQPVFTQLDLNGAFVRSSEKYNPFNNTPQNHFWFGNTIGTPTFNFSGIASESSSQKHFYTNSFDKSGLMQYSLMEGYYNDYALDFKYYNNNLYTCGYTTIREDYSTAFINKYSGTGTLAWTRNIFNNTDRSGLVANIYPDALGVTGTGELQDSMTMLRNASLVSLDHDGNTQFIFSFKDLFSNESSGKLLQKIDNDIFTAGQYKDSLNFTKVFIAKNSGVKNIWVKKLGGLNSTSDSLVDLTVDTLKNIYISYNSFSNGTRVAYSVIKFSADGAMLYNRLYQNNNGVYLKKSICDNAGYLYTLASTKTLNGFDLLTQKLDINGSVMWSDSYGNSLGTDDLASDIALGKDNSIIIASNTVNSSQRLDAFLMKLSLDGERVWNKNYISSNKFIVKSIISDDMNFRYLFGKNVDAYNQEKIMFIQYDAVGNFRSTYAYNPRDTSTLSFVTDFVGSFISNSSGSLKKLYTVSNVNRINRGSEVRINSFTGYITITGINGNETPDKFSLSQNYPNPFNPVTTIKFSLPGEGFARLVIYDINGREVDALVNENLTNGVYEKSFDGSNLASGIYFYKLEFTGSSGQKLVEQKKLILLK